MNPLYRIRWNVPIFVMLTLFSSLGAFAQTGTVLGFGYNRYGQLGDNTSTTRSQPTPTFYVSAIKSVACGTGHTLALDTSGIVWAWGDNSSGQLGTGDMINQATPVAVLYGVKAISAGGAHSLALKSDGTLMAWGFNRYGQLGTGDTVNRVVPVPMGISQYIRFKAIAAGGVHSIALADTGAIYGCGGNFSGQLGLKDLVNRAWLTYIQKNVVAIAAGDGHTLIQDCGNDVWAAGFNAQGQLGDGTKTLRKFFVPVVRRVRAIAAGFTHSLALKQDGTVVGWGDNGWGALGTGDKVERLAPFPMLGTANIKAIAAGGRHSVLLTAGGKVLTVGDNTFGQLGLGSTGPSRATLTQVPNVTMATSVSAGGFDSFILRPFTVASSTGLNNYGQLGTGNTVMVKEPTKVANLTNVIDVASGSTYGMHSLFLRADGTVWSSGLNYYGQLGDGTTTNRTSPVQVKGPGGSGYLSDIIAIAAGDNHSLAVAADGSLYVWGSNQYGQLGLGRTFVTVTSPVHLPYSSGIFAIACGSLHTLVLANDGAISACGWNQSAQLGLGHRITQFGFYVTQRGGSNFNIAIAAGGSHSMSLDHTGEIYAWGSNYTGQLGLGDATDRVYPTRNSGTLATSIACGGNRSLCTTASGQAWGTGANPSGELGLGHTIPRFEWTYNNIVPGTLGAATGLGHSMFLNYGGTLTACGLGTYGQLGNGTIVNRYYPILVSGPTGYVRAAGGAYHSLMVSMPQIELISITVNPQTVKGGTGATCTVTLNGLAGPGGQRVYLSCISTDQNGRYVNAATAPAYIDVPAASNSATFTVTTKAVTSKVTAYISGYLNQSLSANLTITP